MKQHAPIDEQVGTSRAHRDPDFYEGVTLVP
jgi:hypothetical protein